MRDEGLSTAPMSPRAPDADGDARRRRLLGIGVVGTVVTALCCFTPLLVVLLGATALAGVLGWLDLVLIPALLVFLGITVYALSKRRST